jgi:hypothetical protein
MSAVPIRLPVRVGISIVVPALPVHHDVTGYNETPDRCHIILRHWALC